MLQLWAQVETQRWAQIHTVNGSAMTHPAATNCVDIARTENHLVRIISHRDSSTAVNRKAKSWTVIDCPVAGAGFEDPRRAKCSWHASSPPAAHPPPPLPRRTHNFNPPVSRKASAWAHLMPRMKNGARKPPGDALPAAVPVGYRGFMPTTRLSRGGCLALPLALFPQHFLLSSSHWACQEATFTPGTVVGIMRIPAGSQTAKWTESKSKQLPL